MKWKESKHSKQKISRMLFQLLNEKDIRLLLQQVYGSAYIIKSRYFCHLKWKESKHSKQKISRMLFQLLNEKDIRLLLQKRGHEKAVLHQVRRTAKQK